MPTESETFFLDTFEKIIKSTTEQREILSHVVIRMDDMIITLRETNNKLLQVIDSMSHNIPEQLKELINGYGLSTQKCINELGDKIKSLKDENITGFVESSKDIDKMKNRINLLYAMFVIIVVQLVAILMKIFL
jgi:hypothetical protein